MTWLAHYQVLEHIKVLLLLLRPLWLISWRDRPFLRWLLLFESILLSSACIAYCQTRTTAYNYNMPFLFLQTLQIAYDPYIYCLLAFTNLGQRIKLWLHLFEVLSHHFGLASSVYLCFLDKPLPLAYIPFNVVPRVYSESCILNSFPSLASQLVHFVWPVRYRGPADYYRIL